jgi:RNase H-fold protein (predicted Holliday junction resolvase)
MKLLLSTGTNVPFGLEVSVDESSITYQTYEAYDTIELKRQWNELAAGLPTTMDYSTQPTPDMTPAWTTDKFSVYASKSEPVTITFEALKEKNDFSDHAVYSIFTPDSPNVILPMGATAFVNHGAGNKVAMPIHNIIAHSSVTKINPFVQSALNKNATMIAICVPFANSPTSDWDIMFGVHDESLIRVKTGQHLETLADPRLGMYITTTLPKVSFKTNTASVSADGIVDLEFFLCNGAGAPITTHDATVYLKTSAGQLNKQQVVTSGGVGKVKLIASHLDAGDIAVVSCGFKYYTGTDDCTVTVK